MWEEVAAHQEGLLAGVFFPRFALVEELEEERREKPQPSRMPRGSWQGEAAALRQNLPRAFCAEPVSPTTERAAIELARYRELFGERLVLLGELHQGPNDRQLVAQLLALAAQVSVPLVAAGDVHLHAAERGRLCDVLTAVRWNGTVDQVVGRLFSNAERHLKSAAQWKAMWSDAPEVVARSVEVAQRCRFSLEELRYEYPEELCPPGLTPLAHLAELTWAGMRARYPEGVPERVRQLVEYELQLIEELGYEAYFLTVWDLVRFAREQDILCQGRGSAANSAVCYALGVTSVDPSRIDVLFERFVSRERNEAPDIDVDFEHERREEVLQYLYEKYGRERAGITAEVITYRPRSAIRDVGRALGLSLDRIDALAKAMDSYRHEVKLEARLEEVGLDPNSRVGRDLWELTSQLIGFPRHLSQHVGGMVITRGPLCELVPIENAAMAGRTVIEWDKDDLDALGILKVDCLSLGMLTAIRKCFDLVATSGGPALTLANIPAEDPVVYEMISRADTMGVFQIESRAQMSMLPRLKPQTFYDLVIEVAIVRPGPIQGKMVHPYLRRRAGEEAVEYPNEAIREVLIKTLGVPIFQEQAMRLAVVAAGFTPGEADQLRRAMGAWRKTGVIEMFRQKLIEGMLARGLSREFAERLFLQISGFGEYGFPESHAASFALLVYVSSWLKCYYPAAFCAALLNSQPMGFYAPAQLVRDAREHGVEVREIDVNRSAWDTTLEVDTSGGPPAVRLGLRMIAGLNGAHGERVLAARSEREFISLDDLARRTRLPQGALVRLARADAYGSLRLARRQALWDALPHDGRTLPLLDELVEEETPAALPPLSAREEVVADYRTAGLSLRAHPLSFLRERLNELGVTPAMQLGEMKTGVRLRVAGLVLLRQRPGTAAGITFVTLEDETGIANLVVRPAVWERHHHTARAAHALLAVGRLERQGAVIHMLVEQLRNLTEELAGINSRSRDFR